MKIVGLTGGVASGKSSAVDHIRSFFPNLAIFDSDLTVHRLLEEDLLIQDGLIRLFGSSVMTPEGKPDRLMMRREVFTQPSLKKDLEILIHPRVRDCCMEERARAQAAGCPAFIADVPLLFENGFDFGQQINILVAISRATQRSRLISRNSMEPAVADSIIDSQLPLSQKLKLADVVWWNEGPMRLLHSQVSRFFKYFLR